MGGDDVVIGPARKGDASDIAVLMDMAAHGLPAHFWASDRKAGESLLGIGRERVLRDDANFSWRNAWLARIGGDVAGALIGYRQTEDFSKLDMDKLPELVRPLIELEAEAPECWYLNLISVYPEHRNRGIGARFIEQAVRCARDTGAGEIGLIVEDVNEAARRFYARMGFRERASRPFVPFPMGPKANEWILAVRDLRCMERRMADNSYDIIIIGAGPGGYVTAVRAAQLGFKTAVVEREHLGGICSNWGCIPTKALLRSAEIMHYAENAKDYGLKLDGNVSADIKAVVERSRGVAQRMNGGVGILMKKNKVDVIWGEAKFTKPGEIKVSKPAKKAMEPQAPTPKNTKGEGTYTAKHIIVATGARPRVLPGMEPDGKLIWTYFEAMVPPEMPKSLMVIGSGAIGIEFASFYRTMGADVTVIEMMPTIMPVEDAEISKFAQKRFEKQGMKFHLEAKVTKVEEGKDSVTAHVEAKDGKVEKISADRLISAVGVQGNVEGLGLEEIGVKIDRGIIAIDEWCRTNVKGVYAIGDVAGPPMLAHKAEHEGVICVEKIAGEKGVHPLDKLRVPGCTYCHPQVASVGLTEARAKEAGREVRVGRFPFMANGKAVALGEDQGMVKTVFDKKTGELLGAHMVGAEVTELIQGFVVAMNLETTEEELMHTIFPHPTLSEMMKESVLDAYGKALNM